MSSNAARFGEIVLARRRELDDISQVEVWKGRGGPSNSTLTAIEAGKGKPSGGTLKKLDAALGWVPGSARRAFYEGADPTPLAVQVAQPEPAVTARDLTDDELLAELTYRIKRYAATVRGRDLTEGTVVRPQMPQR